MAGMSQRRYWPTGRSMEHSRRQDTLMSVLDDVQSPPYSDSNQSSSNRKRLQKQQCFSNTPHRRIAVIVCQRPLTLPTKWGWWWLLVLLLVGVLMIVPSSAFATSADLSLLRSRHVAAQEDAFRTNEPIADFNPAALAVSTTTPGPSSSRLPATLGWSNLLSAAFIVVLAGGVGLTCTGVPHLARELLTACARCTIQLYLVGGFVLTQFLITADPNPWTVWGWLAFTAILAAREACARIEYTYPQLLRHLFYAILAAAATVIGSALSMHTLGDVQPWFSPRTWIPVSGMLFGSAVTGTALAAGTITREMATKGDQIELRLSRGATWKEAVTSVIHVSLTAALTPVINSLSVTGIVHIPGMMTGQILAGQTPRQAAAYQTLIFFLIGSTTCIAVQAVTHFTLSELVDNSNDRLRIDRLFKKEKAKPSKQKLRFSCDTISAILMGRLYRLLAWLKNATSARYDVADDSAYPLQGRPGKHIFASASPSMAHEESNKNKDGTAPASASFIPVLRIQNMRVSRIDTDVTLDLYPGDRVLIQGRSGAGKTQLLRTIAGLEMLIDPESVRLHDQSPIVVTFPRWRTQIALVPQSRPTLEGTPNEFYEQIIRYASQRHAHHVADASSSNNNNNNNGRNKVSNGGGRRSNSTKIAVDETRRQSQQEVQQHPSKIAEEWDLPSSAFDQPWTTLSGGEAQRVSLAIALSLSPSVLLLDESTSALDEACIRKVEATLYRSKIPIIMVSHSRTQGERFCNRRMDLTTSESDTDSASTEVDEEIC